MKESTKTVKIYISDDGKEFATPKECKNHEDYLKLDILHKRLVELGFYSRFKIVPYFHNSWVTNIKPFSSYNNDLSTHDGYISYCIMYGRMGNGDDMVRLKIRGNHILLIRYKDGKEHNMDPVYLGKIPLSWMHLAIKQQNYPFSFEEVDQLKIEVGKYISERRVFVKKVTNVTTTTYEEI